jgi:hypothetical protein
VSWKVLLGGLTPNLFHLLSTAPDLQFDSISIDFGGHLQGGRNISLLQPERGALVPDLKVIAHHGNKLIL